DVAVYIEALEARIAGATLERVRLASPFLLRSVDPPITAAANRRVTGLRRLGKRIVIGLDGDLFLMLHLMIAGRLHWKAAGAKLSPVKQTRQLSEEDAARLFDATRATLLDWCDRIRAEAAGEFPEGVTAFREGMAVHGRYGKPCPACGSPVQRIAYADNETNYCAVCQTGGRLLADRALSRLLKQDWPRTLEELEDRLQAGRRGVSARSTSASEGDGPSL